MPMAATGQYVCRTQHSGMSLKLLSPEAGKSQKLDKKYKSSGKPNGKAVSL